MERETTDFYMACSLLGVVSIVCSALGYYNYRKNNVHVTLFPGGVRCVGRLCEHQLYRNYFSRYVDMLKSCRPNPSYEELVMSIKTTHPLDSKEEALGALITYQYCDSETILNLFRDVDVDPSKFDWYTAIFRNLDVECESIFSNIQILKTLFLLSKYGMEKYRHIIIPLEGGLAFTPDIHYTFAFIVRYCYDERQVDPSVVCDFILETKGLERIRIYRSVLHDVNIYYFLNQRSYARMRDYMSHLIDTYHEKVTLFYLLTKSMKNHKSRN